jgi:PAS domain S-box-containing protein
MERSQPPEGRRAGAAAARPPEAGSQDADLRRRLYDVFDRAAVGLAQMDTQGRYLLVNDRYCEIVGRTREELLRARMQDFTHADDLPGSLDAFIRVIETGASHVIEHRHIRRDGSAVWVSNSVSIGRDANRQPEYLLAIAQSIPARTGLTQALRESQADLRMLLDSAAEGLYCMDRTGATTLCNAAFLRMLGFQREEDAVGADLHELVHHTRPDGSPYPREDCPIYKAARSGIHAHVVDEVFFRRDGTRFPVEYWVRPIVREGEIRGAICTFVDLTERKRAEERQQLVNQELAHRVKNTLAMVQAIVGQTLRSSPASRDAVQSINSRLVALGNAHTAMTRTRWGNASITDVIEGALAVHRSEAGRIRIEGANVELGSRAALAIALSLHELCTNAAKYGALSNDAGGVSLDWSVTGGAADARFHMRWKERGGPAVTPPTRKGFGSRLIAESIASDLKGEAKLLFEPDGVLWTLDAPLTWVRQ